MKQLVEEATKWIKIVELNYCLQSKPLSHMANNVPPSSRASLKVQCSVYRWVEGKSKADLQRLQHFVLVYGQTYHKPEWCLVIPHLMAHAGYHWLDAHPDLLSPRVHTTFYLVHTLSTFSNMGTLKPLMLVVVKLLLTAELNFRKSW